MDVTDRVRRRLTADGRPQFFLAPTKGEVAARVVGGIAFAAATAYGAYKGYQAARFMAGVVRDWWKGDSPDPVLPAPTDYAASFMPESARPGSEERLMSSPKNQALVGYLENGMFCVVGNAVRMEDWLVIPDHVRSAKPGSLELRSFDQKMRFPLEPLEDHFELIETDLLAVELDQTQWSRCGLAKKRMLPAIPEQRGVYVSVVGAFGKGTTGNLTHHSAFGRVVYTGSTFQGYSGAVYMAGDCVAAIHTHGGSFNGGYSASYILSLLKFRKKQSLAGAGRITYEDSDDWLRQQRDAGAVVDYDDKWQDVDEVRIRVDGRYHIMARSTMAEVYGNTWKKTLGKGRKREWDDYDEGYEALLANNATLSGEAMESLYGALSSRTRSAPSVIGGQSKSKLTAKQRLRKQLAEAEAKLQKLTQE